MNDEVIVFGGTFDPVHNGHLSIARQVLALTDASAVWFVPSNVPSLHTAVVAPAAARLELLQAAIAADDRFLALDLELRRGGVSYTTDTMLQLHAEHPATPMALLLGADSARSIRDWHRFEDLLEQERFLIVNRSGEEPLSVDELCGLGFDEARTRRLEVDSPPIRARDIRRRLRQGDDVGALVPPRVAEIIAREGLYAGERGVHNAGG